MLRSFRDKLLRTRRAWPPRKPAAVQSTRAARLAFESLEPRLVLNAGPLLISEFMAANDNGLSDEDGTFPDWIEIHNPTGEPIDLDAWSLTDDETDLQQWQFPPLVIESGGYQVVFASEKDRRDPLSELHTNFALDRDGEYLALVQPDGTTVADAYAPVYPPQATDISYGTTKNETVLLPSDAEWKHLVPTQTDAPSAWTDPTFNDASWQASSPPTPVLITEAGHGTPDYIEIQNVTDRTIVTDGWTIVVNKGTSNDVDQFTETTWKLPATMAPGKILHATDYTSENYFGEGILWSTSGKGWAMIVDGDGHAVDLAAWSYTDVEMASMKLQIDGATIRGPDSWTGPAVRLTNDPYKTSMMRVGRDDHNDASDFVFVEAAPTNRGLPNPDLILPVGSSRMPGVGYSLHPSGFGGALQTNVAAAMYEVNPSLWMRTTFDVADPSDYADLTLRTQYNDGFVAYLNGHEIARRNAPEVPEWNTTATLARSVAESVVVEEIKLIGPQEFLVEGPNVLAIHGLNVAADDGDFLIRAELLGTNVEQPHRYFADPTPGERNTGSFLGFVADTTFSVDRGFYDLPQVVEITTATPQATIRYTTDGSPPTATTGIEYTAPLSIDATTVLRAAAFKPGYAASDVDTQTYLFGQSDAVKSLPVISLVGDPVDTFSTAGLWSDVMLRGRAAEYPVSFEVLQSDGSAALQQDAGIRLHGSSYRRRSIGANPSRKWSFKVYFRDDYDEESWLNYPLIETTSVDRFKSITLRGGYNDSSNPFIKDELGRRLHKDMGHVVSNGTFANVFVNGQLKNNGYYNPVERIDERMFQEKLGSELPWDVVSKWQPSGTPADPPRSHSEPYYFDVRDGDAVSFAELLDYALANDLSQEQHYAEVARRLDVAQFIDYLILQGYSRIRDWPHNNWNAAREQSNGEWGKWQFYAWDLEFGWGSNELTGDFKTPGGGSDQPINILYDNLRQNDDFRQLFADRAGAAFFNGGALSAENVIGRFEELRAEMVGVLPNMNTYIRDTWAAQRPGVVLDSMVSKGLFTFEGPGLLINGEALYGGEIAVGDVLTMTNPGPSGTIYYTTDGTDPRLPGGGLSPAAQTYADPLTLNGSALLKARVLDGGQFSALGEAVYLLPGDGPQITELLAVNSSGLLDADDESSDWIEIYNPTAIPFDLDGWYLTDDDGELDQWRFPPVTLDPGEYLVVFASGKNHTDPAGELHTNFALSGDGEYLALVRPDGTTIADAFDPAYPPQSTDISYGTAKNDTSLLPIDTEWKYLVPTQADSQSAWTDPTFDDSSWQASGPPAPVLITEAGHGTPDYVEIQNVTEETITTDGWFILLNKGTSGKVNQFHTETWSLPATMAPGQVLYATDYETENYFGEGILWGTGGTGWAMVVDGDGRAVDLAAWSYSEVEMASMNIEINGSTIRGPDVWTGDAVPTTSDARKTSMIRVGDTDHNDASDFVFVDAVPTNRGLPNPDLVLPVGSAGLPGVGYSLHPSGFGGALQTNVATAMYEVNSSLWMRSTFDVTDPSAYVGLTLRVKYNDGFVAYLNGQQIARRNALDAPEWNAAATLARSVDESIVFEEINLVGLQGLLVEGSNVLAIHGLNVAADDGDFLIQAELLGTDVELLHRYFADPSPGERNTESFLGFVDDTKFSLSRGFYDTSQQLEITTATPGASIYYTTDGSRPSEMGGNLYTGPLTIDTTAIVRAVAVKPGWKPTDIDTQTYIFPEDVIRQPANPDGFPMTWGPAPADYQMDPDVVNNPLYSGIIRDSLRTHPTISLVIDPFDLWDPGYGIYANTTKDGAAWERDVSIELIDFPGADDVQVNAGVRIHGSASRNISRPKHNFRLAFRKEYGLGKLDYPLFGDTEVQRFNDLILRGGNGDSWFHPNSGRRPQAQYTHDQWHRDVQVAMGQPTAQQGDVHVYVNGLYWGFYHLIERPEASFMEERFGGDKEDYDVLQHKNGTVNGDRNAWNAMMAILRDSNNDLSTDADYQQALQYVDPVNLADFMLLNFYSANTDWDHNNWYGARKRELGEGWKFFSWDSEVTFRNLSANITGVLKDNQPTEIHQRLSVNAEYKMLFADRAHKHLFNDGTLTPRTVTDDWLTRGDEIDEALVAESARWGDHHRPATPYTVENEFRTRQTELVNTWFSVRTGIVLSQLRARGMYPSVVAPSFEIDGSPRHGGLLQPGERIAMEAPAGTVYYTLDGTDPREPGGDILPGAIQYDGTPILLSNSASIKSRVYNNDEWSALNEAEFLTQRPAAAGSLVVTELNYNPHDPTPEELNVDPDFNNDDFEFIELHNVSSETIDLAAVRFTGGVTLTIDGPVTLLAPGERAVVVGDQTAFEVRYGVSASVVGVYAGSNLNNGGEQITVVDRSGGTIFDFTYNDSDAWPGRADGNGSSLEVLDTTGDYDEGNNWRSSSELGGSPGYEGIGPVREIVINEVLSHTDGLEIDAIELYNPTEQDIDVGGWYLSDESDQYRKFRIPDDTVISAGAYRVFDESDFNPSGGVDPALHPNDFALSGAHGDDVWLLKTDDAGRLTHFADHVDFPAAARDETLGRWPNGQGDIYPMSDNTLGRANTGPRVGPVVISELHYNPGNAANANDLEFVEIYNSTELPIDLTEWRLRGGIDFDFAAGTTLDARSALVVVPLDPDGLADADRLAAFIDTYSIDASVRLVGPYSGKLDNGGENIQLQRPDDSPTEEPEFIPRLLEDEVRYDDTEPWPEEADGNGDSLHRSAVHLWGHSAASWTAALPSPGSVETGSTFVLGRHIFYNNSAWDGHDQAANAQDDQAIATDKQALMPGMTATLANYTNYASGINGIMVDIGGSVDAGINAAEDFIFRLGNHDDTSDWSPAPQPASIAVRPGAGVDGADRVSIVWTDDAIKRQWLQVTVRATEHTGLAEADVFYFGNAIGEAGDQTLNTIVNATDEIAARNFRHGPLNQAAIDDAYDYNRDRLVNGSDQILARENQTNPLSMLRLITPTAVDGVMEQADAQLSSAKIDWLYEFEQIMAKRRSESEKHDEQPRPLTDEL